jgi:hypothetical protein
MLYNPCAIYAQNSNNKHYMNHAFNISDQLVQYRIIGLLAIGLLILSLAVIEFARPTLKRTMIGLYTVMAGNFIVLAFVMAKQ